VRRPSAETPTAAATATSTSAAAGSDLGQHFLRRWVDVSKLVP
jgi:hypothetical protein